MLFKFDFHFKELCSICVAELCISGSFNFLILLSDNTTKYPLTDVVTMPSYANSPMCASLAKHWVHKNSTIPLFLTNFNNSHTIVTRIVSRISVFYSTSKSDNCSSIGVVFKVRNHNWLLFGIFRWISIIRMSFWRGLSSISETVFKIEIRLS